MLVNRSMASRPDLVGFEIGATLAKFEVDHGDRVAKGQVLARLSHDEQEAKVVKARAARQIADVNIRRAQLDDAWAQPNTKRHSCGTGRWSQGATRSSSSGTRKRARSSKLAIRSSRSLPSGATGGLPAWFLVDSAGSLAAGVPLNALLNLGFIAVFLIPLLSVPRSASGWGPLVCKAESAKEARLVAPRSNAHVSVLRCDRIDSEQRWLDATRFKCRPRCAVFRVTLQQQTFPRTR